MSISATNSSVYVNYSSLFSQGGNKTFSAFQAAVANYGNGAFQVRQTSALTLDILDLSAEGLAKANVLKPTEAVNNTEATSDVTLEMPKISEADRVEMIRINKNAVLARVNEIFTEKGIELSADQSFELTTNFLDGSISVAGIDNPELTAAINEALAGDAELIARMKKTREELGLTEPANTVPRNFTIEFGSMLETPADAELEYKIDLFVNQPVPLLEGASNGEETQQTDEMQTKPAFYLSVLLSNKPKVDPTVSILDSLDNAKVTNDKKVKESEEEAEDSTKTPDFIQNKAIPDETEAAELDVESPKLTEEIPEFSAFGTKFSIFSADSKINIDENGMTLDWHLSFSNWISAQTGGQLPSGSTGSQETTQRLFETLDITGSTYYAVDSTNSQSITEQASQLKSQFTDGFFHGPASDWAKNFMAQVF